jgi:hypothetical protein
MRRCREDGQTKRERKAVPEHGDGLDAFPSKRRCLRGDDSEDSSGPMGWGATAHNNLSIARHFESIELVTCQSILLIT